MVGSPAGTNVPPLVLLRVWEADPLLAQPVPSEGEFLCSTPPPPPRPRKPAPPLAARRLYSQHRHRSRYPGPAVADLPRCARAAQTRRCAARPLDVAAWPEPGCGPGRPRLQPAERPLRERPLAAGARLRAQRETRGFGAAAARGSGSLHRLEKTKSKTNTRQRRPHTSAWPLRGRLLGS